MVEEFLDDLEDCKKAKRSNNKEKDLDLAKRIMDRKVVDAVNARSEAETEKRKIRRKLDKPIWQKLQKNQAHSEKAKS